MMDSDDHQLVNHLADAETANLQLREQLLSLKHELKLMKSQAHSGEEVQLLRSEKRSYMQKIDSLQRENNKLLAQSTRVNFLSEDNERLRSENSHFQERLMESERRLNDLIVEKEKLSYKNTEYLQELENLRNDALSHKRSPQPFGPSVNCKIDFHDDIRSWVPQTRNPYREILEFIEKQFDMFVISYRDEEHDSIRMTSDDDCRRAVQIARDRGWGSLKIRVELKIEQELRREILELNLKNKKLRKQVQKYKKAHGSQKKGRLLLDAIMLNRKKDDLIGF